MSGAQEPRLRFAYDLAKALGVTLDYLMDETADPSPTDQHVMVTEDELTILKIVRRLGTNVAIDRLLNVPATAPSEEGLPATLPLGEPTHGNSSTSSEP